MELDTHALDSKAARIWVGIVLGAALGIGIALSRRKRTRWDSARRFTRRVAAGSDDLAGVTRDMVDRVQTICAESRKVVEEAGQLWSRGRKLAGY
jgi:hypothetical protein